MIVDADAGEDDGAGSVVEAGDGLAGGGDGVDGLAFKFEQGVVVPSRLEAKNQLTQITRAG